MSLFFLGHLIYLSIIRLLDLKIYYLNLKATDMNLKAIAWFASKPKSYKPQLKNYFPNQKVTSLVRDQYRVDLKNKNKIKKITCFFIWDSLPRKDLSNPSGG